MKITFHIFTKFYVLDFTDNIIFIKYINISLIKTLFENPLDGDPKLPMFRKTLDCFSLDLCLFLTSMQSLPPFLPPMTGRKASLHVFHHSNTL